jgi:hypothetical protein
MATKPVQLARTEAAILSRLVRSDQAGLTRVAAQALLELRLDREDLNRLHELVTRNQDGALTPDERSELESYLRISSFVDLVQAKARRSLKNSG